jgi:hypothetical protein
MLLLGHLDRKKVGMGSMLGSGEAKKLDPQNTEYMPGNVGITVVASSSCVCLPPISRSTCSLVQLWASASAERAFLCVSQRSVEDARLGRRCLLLSHFSHNVLLPRLDDDDDVLVLQVLGIFFLAMSQRSQDDPRSGLELPHDDAGLLGFLCASHLSTESARPGLGLELDAKEDGRMMMHGDDGATVLLGGVGSRPGRRAAAALAMARSTDAIDRGSSWSKKHQGAGKRSRDALGRGTNCWMI